VIASVVMFPVLIDLNYLL